MLYSIKYSIILYILDSIYLIIYIHMMHIVYLEDQQVRKYSKKTNNNFPTIVEVC